jgi:uncharacterized protein YerC
MCNEKQIHNKEIEEQRFIDYRLDQLEFNLQRGIEKLEADFKTQNTQIMQTLQLLQEGQNKQNQTLVEVTQRVLSLEQKNACIDKLREVATKNRTEIHEIERRLEIYKQIIFLVGGTAVTSFLVALFELITK